MVSLQALLIAEEIQKDARRRAEQERLLKQLPTPQLMSCVSFLQITARWQAVIRTWRELFPIAKSAPCPTC